VPNNNENLVPSLNQHQVTTTKVEVARQKSNNSQESFPSAPGSVNFVSAKSSAYVNIVDVVPDEAGVYRKENRPFLY